MQSCMQSPWLVFNLQPLKCSLACQERDTGVLVRLLSETGIISANLTSCK